MLSVASCSSCPMEFSDGRGPNLDLQYFTALLLGQDSEWELCKPLCSSALCWHFLERTPANLLCISWALSVNTNRDTKAGIDSQEQEMGKDRVWLQCCASHPEGVKFQGKDLLGAIAGNSPSLLVNEYLWCLPQQ